MIDRFGVIFYGSQNDTIGIWGEVTFEDDTIMFVYLGSTTDQLISRMRTVLSFC